MTMSSANSYCGSSVKPSMECKTCPSFPSSSIDSSYSFKLSTLTTERIHKYGGRLSLKHCCLPFPTLQMAHISKDLISFLGPYNLLPCSGETRLNLLPWSCMAFYFSFDSFNFFCTCQWISLILSINISTFNAFHVASSFSPLCCQYTTTRGEGGKYSKHVFKWNLLVEVGTSLL